MAWKSDTTRYGFIAVTIHWITAVAIIALLVTGTIAATTTVVATKAQILRVHAPLGITILFLTIFRMVWWAAFDRKPEPLDAVRGRRSAERIVHGLFYVAILMMGASGISMMIMSGAGRVLFGGGEGPLPDFTAFPPFYGHVIGALLLVALLIGHFSAALWHHFWKRDQLLSRMGLGREQRLE